MLEICLPSVDRSEMENEVLDIGKELKATKSQIIDAQHHIEAYQRVLGLETGVKVNVFDLNCIDTNWRERAQERNCLKSELVNIVDLRWLHDKKHSFDPQCLPSTLNTSREALLTKKDLEFFTDLYLGYHVYKTANEEGAAKALLDYLKLTKNYELKLLHNNAMKDEINAVKKRLKKLQLQTGEDKEFMKYLISRKHPNSDAETEKLSQNPSNIEVQRDDEREKFKNLFEANVRETLDLQMQLNYLKDNIEEVNRRIVQAEKLCSVNRCHFKELENEVLETSETNERYPTQIIKKEKDFKTAFRERRKDLETAENENSNLKKVLLEEILLQKQDFRHFQESLEMIATKFRTHVEQIRDRQIAEKLEKEKKNKKKDKKKKKKK